MPRMRDPRAYPGSNVEFFIAMWGPVQFAQKLQMATRSGTLLSLEILRKNTKADFRACGVSDAALKGQLAPLVDELVDERWTRGKFDMAYMSQRIFGSIEPAMFEDGTYNRRVHRRILAAVKIANIAGKAPGVMGAVRYLNTVGTRVIGGEVPGAVNRHLVATATKEAGRLPALRDELSRLCFHRERWAENTNRRLQDIVTAEGIATTLRESRDMPGLRHLNGARLAEALIACEGFEDAVARACPVRLRLAIVNCAWGAVRTEPPRPTGNGAHKIAV